MTGYEEYYLDADEVYPLYSLIKPRKELCDYFIKTRTLLKVPKDKLEWIKKVQDEYYEVQLYITELRDKLSEKEKRNLKYNVNIIKE